jgi:hypothetical protein
VVGTELTGLAVGPPDNVGRDLVGSRVACNGACTGAATKRSYGEACNVIGTK